MNKTDTCKIRTGVIKQKVTVDEEPADGNVGRILDIYNRIIGRSCRDDSRKVLADQLESGFGGDVHLARVGTSAYRNRRAIRCSGNGGIDVRVGRRRAFHTVIVNQKTGGHRRWCSPAKQW